MKNILKVTALEWSMFSLVCLRQGSQLSLCYNFGYTTEMCIMTVTEMSKYA